MEHAGYRFGPEELVDRGHYLPLVGGQPGDVESSECCHGVPTVAAKVVEEDVEPVSEQRPVGIVEISGETVAMAEQYARAVGVPVPSQSDRSAVVHADIDSRERLGQCPTIHPRIFPYLCGIRSCRGVWCDWWCVQRPKRKAGEGTGLISDLVGFEFEGRVLTDEELLGFCILFIIAGHETTTKMVANVMELLSRHPDQKAAVSADPELVPGTIEEVLRYHNSTQYMHRTLTRDVEMHGRQMHEGDSVLMLIGAANHDDREFGPTAEEFDIFRRPERHLGFGYGAHFCLGAALARMEGKVAVEEILRRIPDYEVDHDAKVRFHSSNVTGWRSLPVTFPPGPKEG